MAAPAGQQNISNFSSMLKEWYTDEKVMLFTLAKAPLFGQIKKKSVGGPYVVVPIQYAGTAGGSSSFDVAQANKGRTSSTKFNVPMAANYAMAAIDRQLILASQKDKGAFLPAAQNSINDALLQMQKSFCINLYGDGSGSRGQISTLTSGNTVITFVNRTSAINFQKGDIIQLAATRTGGSVRTGTPGTATVTAVDRVAGTITVSADITTTITSAAAGDFVYRQGDYDACLKGLAAYVPIVTPTNTLFLGCDRSVDPVALGGCRINGTGQLRYEAMIDALSEINMIGDGQPDKAFTSPIDFRELTKELEAQSMRVRYVETKVPVRRGSHATVGYTGISVEGPTGTVELYQDRFCPPNTCYLLQMEDWTLGHYGSDPIEFIGRDSDEKMLLEPAADGYEIRVASYSNLYTRAPSHSGVLYNWGL